MQRRANAIQGDRIQDKVQEGTQDDYEQCANAKFKASRKYQCSDELMQSKAIGSKTSAGRDPRTYDKEPKSSNPDEKFQAAKWTKSSSK